MKIILSIHLAAGFCCLIRATVQNFNTRLNSSAVCHTVGLQGCICSGYHWLPRFFYWKELLPFCLCPAGFEDQSILSKGVQHERWLFQYLQGLQLFLDVEGTFKGPLLSWGKQLLCTNNFNFCLSSLHLKRVHQFLRTTQNMLLRHRYLLFYFSLCSYLYLTCQNNPTISDILLNLFCRKEQQHEPKLQTLKGVNDNCT